MDNYAIRKASARGHTEVVRQLLATGEVDASANDNEAVKQAAKYGHVDVMKLLLSVDGVDASVDESYALRLAAEHGKLEANVQSSLYLRPDLMTMDQIKGQPNSIDIYQQSSAKNKWQAPWIKFATGIENSHSQLETLLEALSNLLIHIPLRQQWREIPDWLKSDKLTLFCVAASFGHRCLLESLLKDPQVQSHDKFSVLAKMCLKFSVNDGDRDIVSILLKREGINVEYDDNSALIHACELGSVEIVKLLLACELPYMFEHSTAMLGAACENGHTAVVQVLMECDYQFDWTAGLLQAAIYGQREVVKLLLTVEGVDVNAEFEEESILGEAAGSGDLEIVKMIVDAGAM
ncbi:hypothetical protein HDU76_004035 [Blyttiomyces sp. JEL0837]|nr:hypothetical protein HDU76_004035 [Blyttiomyces sp. JEL0837]